MNILLNIIEEAVKEYRNVMSDTQNNSFFVEDEKINTCSENDAKHAFLKMLIKLHNSRTSYKLLYVGSKKIIKIEDKYFVYKFSSSLVNFKIVQKETKFYFCYLNSLIAFSEIEECKCESFRADFDYYNFSFYNYGQIPVNQNDEKIF